MTNFHLLPQDDRWKLTTESGDRIFSGIESKDQAVADAVAIVKDRTGSLKIHRSDGTIEEERTYPRSLDPRKTVG